MRAQGPPALPRLCEGGYAYAQLTEQVAPDGVFRCCLDDLPHTVLLASNSALIIASSAFWRFPRLGTPHQPILERHEGSHLAGRGA
jgi:hypothetical protein